MELNKGINEDMWEVPFYNVPDFPAYVQHDLLSTYPDFRAISHWHDDVEFIFIKSGHMKFNINGTNITLSEGLGLFVNTRQLHHGFSEDFSECEFICVRVHPMLLCSSPYVEKKYVVPVLENEAMPYLLLYPDKTHEKEILRLLDGLCCCLHEELFALKIQGLLFQIWENLFLLSSHVDPRSVPRSQHLSILKDMIRFIYENYTEKVTLAQISRAGKVGKTTCCSIFRQYTNETPISYLINYRMKKSLELLHSTDLTISEICFEVGFTAASYFTETFRRIYGCTPKEYRESIILKSRD